MSKKQIIGASIAAVLFVVIGVTSVFSHAIVNSLFSEETILSVGGETEPPNYDYIGVVSVEGTIQQQTTSSPWEMSGGYQHNTMMDFVDEMMEDEYNKGILLSVDSPGGAVYESEELYNKLLEYKEKTNNPIWTYMAHYGASGGYFVAAPSDKIYANINTTTGSIGVIISGYDLTGLYQKLGIEQISITSGKNKDSSSLNEEQMAIYQEIVNETYERFVSVVSLGRGLSIEETKELADGRIYTASQAKELGLIDEISTYDEMLVALEEETGVSNYYQPSYEASTFEKLFTGIRALVPKSEAEILVDLTDQFGSGVPMYYAEQLQ